MNKQRYLAELQRLLIYMTAADREETIRRYGILFDRAGPGGEEELIRRIGSPTNTSIRLSRNYTPGAVRDEFDLKETPEEVRKEPQGEEKADPQPPEQPEEAPEGAAAPTPVEAVVFPDLHQDPPLDQVPAEEAPPEPTVPPAPAAPRFVAMPLDAEAYVPPPEPVMVTRRSMPLWVGIPLFILLLILTLPLAAAVLALLPAMILPGASILVSSWLTAVGGLWCISYIADALMLFGGAFIILGIALLVLYGGLWLDVAMVKLYIRLLVGMKHLFLGKKVRDYA